MVRNRISSGGVRRKVCLRRQEHGYLLSSELSVAAGKATKRHLFPTSEEAEKCDFRACKRCHPNGLPLSKQHARAIAAACRAIESAEKLPALAELAKSAGMSVFYFHRLFKKITGVTPKIYGTARRSERVREKLVDGKSSVTEAIYDAGFPEELVRDIQDRFPRANLLGGDRDFETVVAHVVGFVEDPKIGLDLPLDVRGTVFQERVWRALTEIPVGQTTSYAGIARRIGAPKSVRAVAAACAANKIAVAIPCHRVVKNDGAPSGYRWGVERKLALLKAEASHA